MTTILNVGCHPKDCLIYSAGTVAKHTARGDKVCNLAVTHGVRWTHWRAVDELSATGEAPDIDALIEEKKREFIFVARKKATVMQINSLIAVIEAKTPPYYQIDTYIKRKVWEEVYNLNSLHGLHSFITEELKSVPKVHMKLKW